MLNKPILQASEHLSNITASPPTTLTCNNTAPLHYSVSRCLLYICLFDCVKSPEKLQLQNVQPFYDDSAVRCGEAERKESEVGREESAENLLVWGLTGRHSESV